MYSPSSYAEMICRGCVKKHNFLANYAGLSVTKVKKDASAVGTDRETTLDVETPEAGTGDIQHNNFFFLIFLVLLWHLAEDHSSD